jgi:hypothetical protein
MRSRTKRVRLKLIGGALTSVAAVGAVASGLLGYWNVWKSVRADLSQEGQKLSGDKRTSGEPAKSLE